VRTQPFPALGPLTERRAGRPASQWRLYELTLPALSMETEFATVRSRLLAEFPRVVEVRATSTPATMLITYRGEDEADAWCQALSDAVASLRDSRGAPVRHRAHGALRRSSAGAEAACDTAEDLMSAA
jgi:hypothetical protein